MDVVLLFPGQGSQKPGMGKDLADAFPAAREVFEEVDEALGFSLSTLCFEGPADELTLTHNAQPALLAHGAAVWAVVRDVARRRGRAPPPAIRSASSRRITRPDATTLADAVRLVRRRGQLMYESGVNAARCDGGDSRQARRRRSSRSASRRRRSAGRRRSGELQLRGADRRVRRSQRRGAG